MKIAFITPGLLPIPAFNGGAIETLLDSLINQNETEGKIDITVLSIKPKEKVENKKYTEYIYFTNSHIFELFTKIINKVFKKEIIPKNYIYTKKVINFMKKKAKEFDYIIIENYPELALKIDSNRVIEYVHSDVFNSSIKNAKQILKKCHKVITVSDFIKERVVEINDKYDDKVITLHNFLDLKKIDKQERLEIRQEIRKKYKIKENDIVYAYSGRISPEKGVLELVKAFNEIKIENKKLLLIGGIWYNSKKKNEYINTIEQIANKNVIFTGYIDHKDIQKYLCAADIGVVPSICNEAAGLSVIEFLNTGNIVVASNKGGIPEYTNDKYCKLVTMNSDNIDELIETLEKVGNDLKKSNHIDYNIKFSEKFSINEYYKKFINILENRR